MITTTAEVTFLNTKCRIALGRYADPPNLALTLITADDEFPQPMAKASFNLKTELPEGYIAIKSWSENEGMADILMEAGVIGPVEGTIPTGFVVGTVHRVLLPEVNHADLS